MTGELLDAAVIVRFWSKVDKESGPVHPTLGRCWVWTGYKKNGYGSISIGNRDRYMHRVSYQMHIGEIPDDREICHHCDNRPCIRPSHFFLGTHLDNIADMKAKGRGSSPPHLYGEKHHMARLTDEQVAEVREIRRTGALSQRATAKKFAVSQATVWRLAHGHYRKAAP